MDKRRHRRVYMDVPIQIQGTDLEGDPIVEDTYTIDISASGARFVTSYEYDKTKNVKVKVHLVYTLTDMVKPGDWITRARIVRIDNVVRTPDGKLKNQHVALQFIGILGSGSVRDIWENARD